MTMFQNLKDRIAVTTCFESN